MLRKRKFWIPFVFFCFLIGVWIFKGTLYRWYLGKEITTSCNYPEKCTSILKKRNALKTEFQRNRVTSLKKASTVFTYAMHNSMFPCWYGTGWSFNGTTETPQQGTIACGYFVTTLLRDAGVPIKRVKLAQCSSSEMIKALVEKEFIYNYNKLSLSEFRKTILKKGEQLYIIGLDNHTGFIACINKEVYFIHSSGALPFCVIKEKVLDSEILRKSSWKLCGAITQDPKFLERWIKN